MPVLTAWGIDIGESAIKAVKVAPVRDYAEIINIDVIPLQRAESEEGNKDIDKKIRLVAALEEFAQRHNPADSTVVVSLPGRITLSKLVTIPPVEDSRLPELVRYEVQQQIPFPINEIVWDYYKCEEENIPGQEVEVNLVAIRKEIVEEFASNFEDADIPVNMLQSAPIALFNLAKYELAPEGNSVIIDVGAENTYLIIIDQDKFWLRTLGIAGNNITSALSKKFEIPFDEAEMLKINSSNSKHSAKIFGVIKPVLHELVGEIHRTIGFYKSMSKDVSFDNIVFLGNSTKLAGFGKFFGENLPYKIQIMQGLSNIRVSRSINVAALKEHLPGLGIAAGLALQGIEKARCKVNLLPESLKKGISTAKITMLVGAVCLLCLSMLVSFFSSKWAAAAAEQKATVFDAGKGIPSVQNLQAKQQKALGFQNTIKSEDKEIRDVFLAELETRDKPARIYAEVQECLDATRAARPEQGQSRGGYNVFEWRDDKNIDLRKLYTSFIKQSEVTVTKVQPSSKRARSRKVTVKIPAHYQVLVIGIVRLQNNDQRETVEYIKKAVVEKLRKSALTIKQEYSLSDAETVPQCKIHEYQCFRTNEFMSRGYAIPPSRTGTRIKVSSISQEGKDKNGKYYIFLIEWNTVAVSQPTLR